MTANQHIAENRGQLTGPSHLFVFLVAIAIVVSRRPDAIFEAQFWAEDGKLWYAHAYNDGGLRSLLRPHTGYLHLLPRLTATLAQLAPLAWAPLVLNLVATLIQVLPVNLLASGRFTAMIPSLPTRLFLGLLYLSLPNSFEKNANITNCQWHLALLAFLVLIASPARSLVGRVFDGVVILLSALTGPFAALLTPIAALRWYQCRQRRSLYLLIGLIAGTLVGGLALADRPRALVPTGATAELFVRILAGQVYLGALVGASGYAWLASVPLRLDLFTVPIAVVGTCACGYAMVRGPTELKLLLLFAAMIFCASLAFPGMGQVASAWELLSIPGIANRFWFVPMLAFVTTLLWLAGPIQSRRPRTLARAALSLMLIGIVLDWRHPPRADLQFRKHADRFESVAPGTVVRIPINPPPDWYMVLIKH